MELPTKGKTLTEVKIQRGIFQSDALSPLISVIAMMPLNHIGNERVDTKLLNGKKRSITDYTWTT